MRKHYLSVLKSYFHEQLILRRTELGLTQEQMAQRLAISIRPYVYLDHGKTCCSALTLALFLIYICDDPQKFLDELRYALEDSDRKAA